jgi:cell division cycle 20-like protein 1 (cofactor of APC complex)
MLEVSTYGDLQNQILVWKNSDLTQLATLTGHLYGVGYMSVSLDGEANMTGTGNETLRFWNMFSKARS